MEYYEIHGDQKPQYYDGEYHPYPARGFTAVNDGEVDTSTLTIRIRTGTRPGDMLFATANVVSARFVDVLTSLHATGYTTAPIRLVKDGATLATFYVLRIHGRGGPFDPVRSGPCYSKSNPTKVFAYEGAYMDESRWDGSDLFFIPGLGVRLFATERVAQAIKRARLKNVLVEHHSECGALAAVRKWREKHMKK